MVDVDNKKITHKIMGQCFYFLFFIINQSISCIPGKNCCDSSFPHFQIPSPPPPPKKNDLGGDLRMCVCYMYTF